MTSTHDAELDRPQRDTRLNLRATAQQQQLIRSAAATQGKTVTEFILESATVNAERVLADRRWFILSHEAWGEFEVLLDGPGATEVYGTRKAGGKATGKGRSKGAAKRTPSVDSRAEATAASPRLAALLNEPTVFDRPSRKK
jgi:uncharacterized protein (DUF1778 family)